MENKNEIKILTRQPTISDPVIVENYPYGFRLRTKIKYWVETTKYGQRFCSQTLNPKTNTWNNPKKSTYDNIILVGLNEQDHITRIGLHMYSMEEAVRFKEKYESFLNDWQKTELINIIKMLEVYDKVEFSFKPKKFRNIITGEITEQIEIFKMDEYEEVNEEGQAIDPDKERQKHKEINIRINQAAVLNASKETDIDSAIKTFKRSG
jgi:hypothetical protein